ncbi:hypothetical protein, partial [Klebsiella pneumoniae]|uniref:hypothetical protein n=1 Tax=Klebsiella pneumoniae TaxID=573 RepID=UPI001C8F4160
GWFMNFFWFFRPLACLLVLLLLPSCRAPRSVVTLADDSRRVHAVTSLSLSDSLFFFSPAAPSVPVAPTLTLPSLLSSSIDSLLPSAVVVRHLHVNEHDSL